MGRIYTKVGDKGETSLVGGQKVTKNSPRLEAYGTVDELNCCIGLARTAVETARKNAEAGDYTGASDSAADLLEGLGQDLEQIQHWLFNLGSLLAALPADREKFKLPAIDQSSIDWIEKRIDAASAELPELKNFIIPGGSDPSARLQLARTLARRAERHMVEVGIDLPDLAIPFINRLSDYLFVMARFCNYVLGMEETIWKKG